MTEKKQTEQNFIQECLLKAAVLFP